MPRPCLSTIRRTICVTAGAAALIQITPCMAEQGSGFSKRSVARATDYPASTGRFTPRRDPEERSGPADLATASTTVPQGWRMCRECGYDGDDPKPFKAVGLRASFQPIGGTFSYRF